MTTPIPDRAPIIKCPGCRHWGDVLARECRFCLGSRRVYEIVPALRPCALCEGRGSYLCECCGGSGCEPSGPTRYEPAPAEESGPAPASLVETIHGGLV